MSVVAKLLRLLESFMKKTERETPPVTLLQLSY